MRFSGGKAFVMAGLCLAFAGCASKSVDHDLDEKLAQETPMSDTQIRQQSAAAIDQSPNLTAEQKKALADLRASTTAETRRLTQENMKLRSLLVKDLMAENYNAGEVEMIKSRLQKNENKRLSLVFDAVEKTNRLLGRTSPENRFIIHRLFDMSPTTEFE